MKITKLKISAYRGIAELETAIAPAGAVFSGGNARGKTTCINAIKACLTAQEVSNDAVRLGSEKSELLIDLDNHTVRRAISRNAPSKLTVERDGMKASKRRRTSPSSSGRRRSTRSTSTWPTRRSGRRRSSRRCR